MDNLVCSECAFDRFSAQTVTPYDCIDCKQGYHWHVDEVPRRCLDCARRTGKCLYCDAWISEYYQLRNAFAEQNQFVEQTLAQALGGFPWYKDDPKNFPGATEENGVCVGELVVEDLAHLAAERIKELERMFANAVKGYSNSTTKYEHDISVLKEEIYRLNAEAAAARRALNLVRVARS